MPLRLHDFLDLEGEIAVWITEDADNLLADLKLTLAEEKLLKKMSNRRVEEWSSARWLIHYLSGRKERATCLKDEYGKPYLVESPYQISVSHSLNYTAVIAAPYAVGIDVQEIVPKMQRIAKKFVNDKEWEYLNLKPDSQLEMLHIIWGAKEAMYKAWGKKKIDFKGHLFVPSFEWNGEKIITEASLIKANIHMSFYVIAEKVDNFILVYVREKARYVQ